MSPLKPTNGCWGSGGVETLGRDAGRGGRWEVCSLNRQPNWEVVFGI